MERSAPFVIGRNRATDVPSIRKAIDRAAALQPNPRGVRFRRGMVGGVNGEWLEPKKTAGNTVLLYLHGGGYVAGSPATHRLMVGSLVRRASLRAFVPDYRLAPENPRPAQLEDALAVYRRIVDVHGADNLVLAGDSAGGGLAVLLCCAARDAGLEQPRRLALLSPWVDLSGPTSNQESARSAMDIVMSAEQIRTIARLVEGREPGSMSPVDCNLHHLNGLPPTLVQVGTAELIGYQGEHLAARLNDAGVDVRLERWLNMQHVFQTIFIVPERRSALDRLAAFLTA
jgi:acetyl esterase/lipase